MARTLLIFFFLLAGPLNLHGQSAKENADFKLALNLYTDKLYDLAAEQFRQFISNYPGTPQGIEARFYLGLTQLRLGRHDEARLTFQTFALTYQDNPKAAEAWLRTGEAFAAMGNHREAALAYERVKVFHPRSELAPVALVEASSYFKRAGDPESARRVLRIVLQEYPSSNSVSTARTQLGRIYFEEGNIDLAQSELTRVIEGDPSPGANAQALLTLGNIYEATGRWNSAEKSYQEVIANHKNSSALQGAYVSLGNLQMGSGRHAEALENYKKASSVKSSDSALTYQALVNSGEAAMALKEHSSAAGFFERALSYSPHQAGRGDALWHLALAQALAGKYQRSNEACTRLLKSAAPDELKRRAQVRLALNSLDQKKPGEAILRYAEFLDRFPDDEHVDEVVFRIATIYETMMNDPGKASAHYELIQTRYPHSHRLPEALAGSGRSYEKLKEYDRAVQAYREFLSTFPSAPQRETVERSLLHIQIFEAKDKETSMDKLALLVGDMLTEQDKSSVAYRLGAVYFEDLKNYSGAATQFERALAEGLSGEQALDATFRRARSLEYLSWKDDSYRQKAVQAYRDFLQQQPADRMAEQAALSLFSLTATSIASSRQGYIATLSVYPNFGRRDTLLLCVGTLYEKSSERDSAMANYSAIVRDYSSSASCEEALFRLARLIRAGGLTDSSNELGRQYLGRFATGRHAATVLEWLASDALTKGQTADAVEYYTRLNEQFGYASGGTKYVRLLAEARVAAGDYDEGIELLEKQVDTRESSLLEDGTFDPRVHLILGRARYGKKQYAEAKRQLFAFLARQRTGPDAGEAYHLLGIIHREEGTMELAAAFFKQASSVAPTTSATYDAAELLFEQKQYDDAIAQYRALLDQDTSASVRRDIRAKIIVARFRSDDIAAADKEAAAFVKSYPDARDDAASFRLERGLHFYRKENNAAAKKEFDIILKSFDESPSAPVAMYWNGKILEASNKPDEAIKQFSAIQSRYPDAAVIARVHLALGNIFYNKEKWDEAIRNYRVVVDDPSPDREILPFAMNNLIEAYEAAGIFDAALSITRRYLELYPTVDDAFDKKIRIGILYMRLGYHEQAVLHLQQLLEQGGSDLEAELRFYIGEAQYHRGDYQQAILEFLKVPYLISKKGKIDWTANALYMCGQSYEKLGKHDQALQMYQQIIDRPGIDPTFKSAARKEIDRVQLVLKKGSNGSR